MIIRSSNIEIIHDLEKNTKVNDGGKGMTRVDSRENGRAIGHRKCNQLIKEFCSTQMQKNEETAPRIV